MPAWLKAVRAPPPDPPADEGIHAVLPEEARQGSVAGPIRVQQGAAGDLAVRHIIDHELPGVTEVAEYLAVFIGDCNFHFKTSPLDSIACFEGLYGG